MANLKDLRSRIRSVKGISQITKAMEMVATTKLRRVQGKAVSSRPYSDEIQDLVHRMARHVQGGARLPLFQAREVRAVGLVVVTSDRGLCGSYNTNLLAEVHRFMDAHPGRRHLFYVYGRKGYVYLTRRGYQVERFFIDPPLEAVSFLSARAVGTVLTGAFLEETVDEVYLCYTAFKSMARHVPTVEPFLPLSAIGGAGGREEAARQAEEAAREERYILEPGPEGLFDRLIPRFLETKIFNALMESVASEYAARRIAMKNATDAAVEMAGELRRTYNRARQESITRELLDIVGGAEALR